MCHASSFPLYALKLVANLIERGFCVQQLSGFHRRTTCQPYPLPIWFYRKKSHPALFKILMNAYEETPECHGKMVHEPTTCAGRQPVPSPRFPPLHWQILPEAALIRWKIVWTWADLFGYSAYLDTSEVFSRACMLILTLNFLYRFVSLYFWQTWPVLFPLMPLMGFILWSTGQAGISSYIISRIQSGNYTMS